MSPTGETMEGLRVNLIFRRKTSERGRCIQRTYLGTGRNAPVLAYQNFLASLYKRLTQFLGLMEPIYASRTMEQAHER